MSSDSLRSKALALLAQREYSRVELEKKLCSWLQRKSGNALSNDCDEDQSDKPQVALLLDDLQRRGILSDERALESLLNQKASRLGSVRIKQVLLNKGLEAGMVQNALDELKDSEFERACAAWLRKFNMPPLDPASYSKQARFLSYRGFSADIVKKVLAQMKSAASL